MKAAALPRRTAPTAPSARAEAIAILAGALVALLLERPSSRPSQTATGQVCAQGAKGRPNG